MIVYFNIGSEAKVNTADLLGEKLRAIPSVSHDQRSWLSGEYKEGELGFL